MSTRYTFQVVVVTEPPVGVSALWPDLRPVPHWLQGAGAVLQAECLAGLAADAHTDRVKTAGHLYANVLDLDSSRCRFEPTSLVLAGTVRAPDVQQAVETVFGTVHWTMQRLYGVEAPWGAVAPPPPITALTIKAPR